jgi:hypothetical protein
MRLFEHPQGWNMWKPYLPQRFQSRGTGRHLRLWCRRLTLWWPWHRFISWNFPSFQTKHFCESETSYSFGWENHRLIIDEFQEGGNSLANDISDLHQEPWGTSTKKHLPHKNQTQNWRDLGSQKKLPFRGFKSMPFQTLQTPGAHFLVFSYTQPVANMYCMCKEPL